MVETLYEEPHRGYALTLFCACVVDKVSGRVIGITVVPGEHRDDEMLTRLCADLGHLVTYHLRMGVLPDDLAAKLHRATAGGEAVGTGPGQAKFPIHRQGVCLIGLTSPLQAIVTACIVAETDWRRKTQQLAQEGVVGHA